jgi:hypothetical protein
MGSAIDAPEADLMVLSYTSVALKSRVVVTASSPAVHARAIRKHRSSYHPITQRQLIPK